MFAGCFNLPSIAGTWTGDSFLPSIKPNESVKIQGAATFTVDGHFSFKVSEPTRTTTLSGTYAPSGKRDVSGGDFALSVTSAERTDSGCGYAASNTNGNVCLSGTACGSLQEPDCYGVLTAHQMFEYLNLGANDLGLMQPLRKNESAD